LLFDVQNSIEFTVEEKELLLKNIKFTKENLLILHCDENRSQHKNKEIVIKRFLKIISNGLKIPKKRKATKPSKSSIKKRLEKKRKQAYKKVFRKKPTANE